MFGRTPHEPSSLSPEPTGENLRLQVGSLQPDPQHTESSGPIETLSYWQRVRKLIAAGSEDFKDKKSGVGQKLGLLATAGWLAYEWGPGNEAATPIVAGFVLDNSEGAMAPVATGIIAGTFTFAQQAASGSTAAYTASTFPRLASTTYTLFNEKEEGGIAHKPWKELPFRTRWFYAFMIGSTFGVVREAAVTPQGDNSRLYKTAGSSALITGGTVGAIGAGAGALKWAAEGTQFEPASDTAIHVMENPLTWLGVFGSIAIVNYIKDKRSPATAEHVPGSTGISE